jgi:dTDP-4-dehydrorhamnose reductase
MSRPLTILQFGRTGQLAREMLARAPARGCEIQALSRSDIDLADAGAVANAVRDASADLVLNAAAYTAVDRAESEPDLAMAINAAAPAAMAKACAKRGLPLIHLSTDYVFDGAKAGAWREDDPRAPTCAYGRSKAEGEAAVEAAGGRAVILRTSWVFSAHGSNFVKTMLALAKARPELRVVADQRGRPTAAGDLADAILAIAPRLVAGAPEASGVFHFAGEGTTSWAGFAEAIFELAGDPKPKVIPIPTADYPTPARRPLNSELDCGRIERVFGLRPRPWRDGLAEALHELAPERSGAAA